MAEDELELAAVEGAHPSRVGVVRGQVVVVVPEMGERVLLRRRKLNCCATTTAMVA